MEKCKSFILTLLVSLLSVAAYAQEFVCSGTIVDDAGEPIIGASVFQKGSTKGAVSDFNGEFKLAQVPEGSVITVSYIGYKTVEAKAAAGMVMFHKKASRRPSTSATNSWLTSAIASNAL